MIATQHEYDSYSLKHSARVAKLARMLGSALKLDVALVEIQREGLKAMLLSRIPLAYFLAFLYNSYSPELLYFFHDVTLFTSDDVLTDGIAARLQFARSILITYIERDSPLEINIDAAVRDQVRSDIRKTCLDGCFDAARLHVLELLETLFAEFVRSEMYQILLQDSDSTSVFAVDSRLKAYAVLQSAISKNARSSSPRIAKSKMQMNVLLVQFCTRVLEIGPDGKTC